MTLGVAAAHRATGSGCEATFRGARMRALGRRSLSNGFLACRRGGLRDATTDGHVGGRMWRQSRIRRRAPVGLRAALDADLARAERRHPWQGGVVGCTLLGLLRSLTGVGRAAVCDIGGRVGCRLHEAPQKMLWVRLIGVRALTTL
eukprot:CAMPEP_0170214998 /NCGR_PEP_ID=MMETSP0116_2-20130129/7132_1 /TAXON_ID=400756 /ORGANISM="Durinskia baltica, Strain CSIRO CS-38" /LENGTH=145 /DNA_ID=CAMNT_0010465567 /DNA_START=244 /DNA_END=682 /DNA_ORIENTATION=+